MIVDPAEQVRSFLGSYAFGPCAFSAWLSPAPAETAPASRAALGKPKKAEK
jgi:hypothetical protein